MAGESDTLPEVNIDIGAVEGSADATPDATGELAAPDTAGERETDHIVSRFESLEEDVRALGSQLAVKADIEHEHDEYARHDDVDAVHGRIDDILRAVGDDLEEWQDAAVAPVEEPIEEETQFETGEIAPIKKARRGAFI